MFGINNEPKMEKKIKKIIHYLSVCALAKNSPPEMALINIADLKKTFSFLKNEEMLVELKNKSQNLMNFAAVKDGEYLMRYAIALKEAIRIMESNNPKNKDKLISLINNKMKALNEKEIKLLKHLKKEDNSINKPPL